MMKLSLVLQDSDSSEGPTIARELGELGGAGPFRRLRVAVAYATLSGCQDLVAHLKAKIKGWRSLQKEWLISIDFGRTESEALKYLLGLPNSEVRIPSGEELLGRSLIPYRCFHPKTFVFDCGIDDLNGPFALLVGSGNITLSGLNTGVEHATSILWVPPYSGRGKVFLHKARRQLDWWDDAWRAASLSNEEFLLRYARIRPPNPKEDQSHAVRSFASRRTREVESFPGLAWAHARCFWIQTYALYKNLGKQRPGNQLDLKRGSRVYFGFSPDSVPRNTVLGSITVQYQDAPPRECNIRFADNSMDKINLPIPGEDGPLTYDNTVVHFERTGAGLFRVSLGRGRNSQAWRNRSAKQGTLYNLAGGRAFGFYN